MSPALQISNYQPLQPSRQFQSVIQNLIFMRKHKEFKIERPALDFAASDKEWYDSEKNRKNMNFFMTEQEEREENKKNNKILLKRQLKDNDIYCLSKEKVIEQMNAQVKKKSGKKEELQTKKQVGFKTLKRKLIMKAISKTVNRQKQRQIQKSYCKYLIHWLHNSNLYLIHNNIPPNLSVLETIEDGDYLDDNQRKQDYPHYSNVLQPIQLPAVMSEPVQIIRQPVRIDPSQAYFNIETTTIFKKLFEQSISFCERIREKNFNGDFSLRLENENHEFQKLADIIGLNCKTAKLLYDMLNDHYDIQKQLALGKSDDYKVNVRKQLIELVRKEVRDYYQSNQKINDRLNYCRYIPIDQYYLSLRDLRYVFLVIHDRHAS